jgi:hypothetical protein
MNYPRGCVGPGVANIPDHGALSQESNMCFSYEIPVGESSVTNTPITSAAVFRLDVYTVYGLSEP